MPSPSGSSRSRRPNELIRQAARQGGASGGLAFTLPPGIAAGSASAQACRAGRNTSATSTRLPNAVSAHYNFSGPNTVNLSGTYALEISVGCTWSRVNSRPSAPSYPAVSVRLKDGRSHEWVVGAWSR